MAHTSGCRTPAAATSSGGTPPSSPSTPGGASSTRPVPLRLHALQERCHLERHALGVRVPGHLNDARQLFDRMPERNVVSWTSMLCALLRAGRTREAKTLFDTMPQRNVVSWNAMVSGLARNGELTEARRIFDAMPQRDRASWSGMIAAYAERSLMGEAQRLFERASGAADVVSWTAMIAGHCRAGDVGEAHRLFREMAPAIRNVVTWTAMIGGFAWNGRHEAALRLFLEMKRTSPVEPNSETLIALLYTCTGLRFPTLGRQVHAQTVVNGMTVENGGDGRLGRCLIQMYARLGAVDWACWIFRRDPPASSSGDDTICWNSMIFGYAQAGQLDEARRWFDGTPFPDQITATTMISAYLDAGEVSPARLLFDQMKVKDSVAWTAVISGLVQNELVQEAMEVFSEMKAAAVPPLDHTFAALLGAAGSAACLEMGQQLHALAVRTRPALDTAAGNALAAMYSKCGDVTAALRAFSAMPSRDVVSWNAMIVGLSHHGLAGEALELFHGMPMAPTGVSFLGALTACSHAGLHYACMVHLLARAGRAAEAECWSRRFRRERGSVGPLAAACAAVEGAAAAVGERAARRAIEEEPRNAAALVGLRRLYAAAERRAAEGAVGEEMRAKGVRKAPGMSWVVVRGRTHAFLSGDRSTHRARRYAPSSPAAGSTAVAPYRKRSKRACTQIAEVFY
ncbi:unnamed protein product [Spirodela intermedia]|uniref:Uncharacterized protein n=1 Tax=Spirodela intermedia TaxID=51605 RepID=A0A7I8JUN6_SPIIN|nr:unnamed protein product [Spirodela intermedia]CAA6673809.1 unnamed protein product [Spirodela intermedia]